MIWSRTAENSSNLGKKKEGVCILVVCIQWMHTQAQAQTRVTEHEAENKMDQNAMCKMPSPMIHAPIKACWENIQRQSLLLEDQQLHPGTVFFPSTLDTLHQTEPKYQQMWDPLQSYANVLGSTSSGKCGTGQSCHRWWVLGCSMYQTSSASNHQHGNHLFVRGTFRKLVNEISFLIIFPYVQVIGSNSCAGHEFLLWIPEDKVPKFNPFSDWIIQTFVQIPTTFS